ncbi:glycoside hydrolase family 3 N-terminal domain-containing protein [Sanguibacter suaedae]|uniref:Glycoside hydrolase family 3 C-terminal domain-containing protein n=1 Tax=Sanguibacter suaedae TaxID=2795737 RepID=A0A934MAZ0_9MICO|nr:glycoside hydrolase family 3 N-terminal domain-containing protein [Sanguibacter suaedae]MBI9116125.1 glycoside hydrolase family 3 C-terminal domain-containing protein [Sanguibacter suaedae]
MNHPTDDDVRPAARTPRDLLALLTLDEKLALLHQVTPGVPRLGLAPFRTGTEALHGVSWLGTATVFPQPVGLAATWDLDLLEKVGDAVATEVRAKHAADPSVSLNVWAPVVNPLRHPLWGRNEEGYSEDPHLTADLATAYSRGLRGTHPTVWKTVPTLKHFLAYNNEVDRAVTSSQMRPRVLHEYELPAFRGPIEAGVVGAVMPAYNLVNGRPCHVSRELLDELRSWTTGSLAVVSDAGAPTNLVDGERYFATHTESHAAALLAGVDSFTDNDTDAGPTVSRMQAALDEGLVTVADIDRAVLRLLELRERTGELSPDDDPYRSIGAEAVDLPEHRALARRAVARSVVVLQNDGILPLRPTAGAAPRSVAVVGPLAERTLHDWYSGTPPYLTGLGTSLDALLPGTEVTVTDGADRVALRSRTTGRYVAVRSEGTLVADDPTCSSDSTLEVTDWGEGVVTLRSSATGALVTGGSWILRATADRVGGWVAQETFRLHRHDDGTWSVLHVASGRWLHVQHGSGVVVADSPTLTGADRFDLRTLSSGEVAVAEAAAAADVVVVAVGNDPHVLGRETEDRPGLELPRAAHAVWRAAREANPHAVLSITSSYPYALGGVEHEASAVVWSSHGGQEHGAGLAAVLVGEEEPAGRLAQEWVADGADLGDVLDYDVIDGRSTYWYRDAPPLYPFGHGLTYSTVELGPARLDGRTVVVEVTNTGPRAVHEVVQVYASARAHRLVVPVRRLAGYARVDLAPGERRTVTVAVDDRALSVWDVRSHTLRVEPGAYDLGVGLSSRDLRSTVPLEVTGDPVAPVSALGRTVRAVDFDAWHDVRIAERTLLAGEALDVAPGRGRGWVELAGLDLDGVRSVALVVARSASGPAWVAVGGSPRLDVPAGGGRHEWAEVLVDLDDLHDLDGSAGPGLAPGGAEAGTCVRVELGGAARLTEVRFV